MFGLLSSSFFGNLRLNRFTSVGFDEVVIESGVQTAYGFVPYQPLSGLATYVKVVSTTTIRN